MKGLRRGPGVYLDDWYQTLKLRKAVSNDHNVGKDSIVEKRSRLRQFHYKVDSKIRPGRFWYR